MRSYLVYPQKPLAEGRAQLTGAVGALGGAEAPKRGGEPG